MLFTRKVSLLEDQVADLTAKLAEAEQRAPAAAAFTEAKAAVDRERQLRTQTVADLDALRVKLDLTEATVTQLRGELARARTEGAALLTEIGPLRERIAKLPQEINAAVVQIVAAGGHAPMVVSHDDGTFAGVGRAKAATPTRKRLADAFNANLARRGLDANTNL